jgi:hypothetical protein
VTRAGCAGQQPVPWNCTHVVYSRTCPLCRGYNNCRQCP